MTNPTTPTTLTGQGRQTLLRFVDQVFSDWLDQSYRATTDFPGYIRDADSPPPFLLLPVGLTRQTCRRWARGDALVRGPGFDAAWGAICNPYLDSIGEDPSDGSLAPPFTGGQCVGGYGVEGTYTSTCTNPAGQTLNWSGAGVVQGPIQGVQIVNDSFRVVGSGNSFVNCNVAFTSLVLANAGPGKPVACSQLQSASQGAENVRITRLFPIGFPDNCGDPPPDYLPPQTPTGLPPLSPIPINVPGIGPVDFQVDFDADGNIEVCFPDLDFCTTIANPFGPDATPGGTDPTINDPGTPGTPEEPGAGELAEGTVEEDEELVGVLVELIANPPNANRFQNISAQVFRGIGYVRMGWPGRLGVDVSASTVEFPQFFHAQQRGLKAWAVRPNVGFRLRSTPYTRTIEP